MLNILVCVKQVPDINLVKMDPVTGSLIRAGVPAILNPLDANALEAAVRVKEAHGGTVTVITMGPDMAKEALREVLPLVDLVLVMSVEPGFGGQSFIPGSLEKIAQLRAMAREMGLETIIEVDGGISARNAGAVYGAGADVLVAGSSVFGAEDPQAEVVKMLNA